MAMRFELTHLIRDPHSGAQHLPHEDVEIFKRLHDSLDRELLYARFPNGDSTILFPTDCEQVEQ
jgi:hypothetical protein